MYTISKKFTFDAAHRLKGLPPSHKCSHLHGHTYTVEIIISAIDLDEGGFVLDFTELAPLKNYIDTVLDHTDLNKVLPFNPTSENIARHLHGVALDVISWPPDNRVMRPRIRVSETPNTWAEYA